MTPYDSLPKTAFWKPAVAEADPTALESLWQPKFEISAQDLILTAGSCFAQNIGRQLRSRGLRWYESETPPADLPRSQHEQNGYGLFSFRTGNIYTAPLLLQWVQWALGTRKPDSEVWQADDRFHDPFRPSISVDGFPSAEEVLATRQRTLEAMLAAIRKATLFIFTPGLTEAWVNCATGAVYPACPGTVKGRFDPERHEARIFGYADCRDALDKTLELLWSVNPGLKILLTVSPVPITATISGMHVLAANFQTKNTLRTVVGEIADQYGRVDYFPSFELIGNPCSGARYFAQNGRTITEQGIDAVMRHFFKATGSGSTPQCVPTGEIICEDELLEYYAPLP